MELSPLGEDILTAAAEQGWVVLVGESVGTVGLRSPNGDTHIIPLVLLEEEDDGRLGIILMSLIVVSGLEWPWPPELDEEWQALMEDEGDSDE